MSPQTQRRRRTGRHEEEGDIEENPRQRRQAKRAPESDGGSDASEDDGEQDVDMDGPGGADNTSEDQFVKKFVRYALACEYARIPIKRDGIRDKVLGAHARSFRRVFDAAQEQLQKVFGMEMVELPVREKRTLKDKQKAVKRGASQASASSRQYILVSTLPKEYRTQSVIGPSRVPSTTEEASYVGFYTVIISLITLSSGELSDMKLRRYLTRLNASQNLPMDKTDNVLQKLIRQGYLDKIVERIEGDEDAITWCVGPRGKVEVSPQSIAQMVSEVWGEPLDDEFDKKLEKSLGVQRTGQSRTANAAAAAAEPEDD
ncbi:putative mage family protein [Rosellinia necatrix]|uniref:Putative mage family protein n=1 Tax=Rosellinia necatrix TaxID=77044 RepID=A0A1W2TS60_ROSNE|nr:putative mage family protein [Rosellinia necatrix]